MGGLTQAGINVAEDQEIYTRLGQHVDSSKVFMPFDQAEIERSIPERFEYVVSQYPDRIAIKGGSQVLTYDDLDRASNQVTQAILAQRGAGAEPIALVLEHGIAPVVSLLGVLKAGKFYVVLDTSLAHSWLTDILKDLQPHLLVTNQKNFSLAAKLAPKECQIINLDELDSHVSDEKINVSLSPDSLAAIFYTSGSTGQPKGVTRSHRNILHNACNIPSNYYIYIEDHHSLMYSCSFAASEPGIFDALLNGAAMYPYNVKETGLEQLVTWIIQEEITIFNPPVTLFRQFLDLLTGRENFPKLRTIVLGGQPVYKHDVERFRNHFSANCLLVHLLALTEANKVARFFIDHQIEIPGNIVPVGYAIEGKEILLLDGTGQKLSFNEVGEIAVRSRYLSPGYWRNPELTRQKFLPDPDGGDKRIYLTGDLGRMRPDGCLEYLGRKDFQVKIRGYRVELAEIEAALHDLASVNEAVVIASDQDTGDKRLVAYLVPSTQPAPTVSELRCALMETLPDYKIPSVFVMLTQLPLTSSGKVDRQALPAPDRGRPELATDLVTPRDELERQLAQIFEEILRVQPIGVCDNFFDLGGDSLRYLRLFTEIERRFGQKLSIEEVIQTPTIEHLAEILHQSTGISPRSSSTSPEAVTHNPFELIREVFKTSRSSWAEKFRHSRHILLHQLRHIGPDFDDVVLPYPIGTRFLSWFCRQRWIQRIPLFQPRVHLVRQCLAYIDSPVDETEVIRHSLTCNFWHLWRLAALEACTPEQFKRWVAVTGFSTVQQAYEKGQGVILVTGHFALSPLITLFLDRMGLEHSFIGGWKGFENYPYPLELLGLRRLRQPSRLSPNITRDSWRNSQLYMGKQVLQQGGIVRIGADGYQGQNWLTVPFYGRMRGFKAGFAELAVSTGSDVIPARVSIEDRTGQVQIMFLEPLDVGSADMNHQTRVEFLIRQYIDVFKEIWAKDLGSISWEHLEKFLALPPVPHKE